MRRQRGARFPLGCLSLAKTRQLGRKKKRFLRQKFSADFILLPVSLLIAAPPTRSLPLTSSTRPRPEENYNPRRRWILLLSAYAGMSVHLPVAVALKREMAAASPRLQRTLANLTAYASSRGGNSLL